MSPFTKFFFFGLLLFIHSHNTCSMDLNNFNKCKSDNDCVNDLNCVEGLCTDKCFKCSDVYRKNMFCAKMEADCGPCILGYYPGEIVQGESAFKCFPDFDKDYTNESKTITQTLYGIAKYVAGSLINAAIIWFWRKMCQKYSRKSQSVQQSRTIIPIDEADIQEEDLSNNRRSLTSPRNGYERLNGDTTDYHVFNQLEEIITS